MIKLFRKKSSPKKLYTEQDRKNVSPAPKQTELQNDAEFLEHFDEFIGVEFYSHNGLSGGSHKRRLVASEHPELKEKILSFTERYPINNLLNGDRNNDGFDLDHWEITFIFENTALNRSVCGYGVTECTKPYLYEMIFCIPEVLSEEEIKIQKEQYAMLMMTYSQFDDEKSE